MLLRRFLAGGTPSVDWRNALPEEELRLFGAEERLKPLFMSDWPLGIGGRESRFRPFPLSKGCARSGGGNIGISAEFRCSLPAGLSSPWTYKIA